MAIFSTSQPGIRARLLPRFPAPVLSGTGITITKNGGTYVFAAIPASDVPLSALAPMPAGTVVGRDGNTGDGVPTALIVSGGLITGFGGRITMSPNQRSRSLSAQFINPVTNMVQDFSISTSSIVRRVTLLANAPGNVVVDILRSSFANFPTMTSICSAVGATKPTLTGQQKLEDITLTNWDTGVAQGDVIRVGIVSAATITRLAVGIDVEIQ
jgi:hypothetical protein